MKKGDFIYLKESFWHLNTDLGGRRARILSTESYILVEVYGYGSNPVKCFRNEVSDMPIELERKQE